MNSTQIEKSLKSTHRKLSLVDPEYTLFIYSNSNKTKFQLFCYFVTASSQCNAEKNELRSFEYCLSRFEYRLRRSRHGLWCGVVPGRLSQPSDGQSLLTSLFRSGQSPLTSILWSAQWAHKIHTAVGFTQGWNIVCRQCCTQMCLDTEMKYVEHKCAYTWESAPRAVDDIGDTDGRQLPQFPNQRRRSAFEMIMTMFRNLATIP